MKLFITVCALALFAITQAHACSPALPATAQLMNVDRLLSSQAFKLEIQAHQRNQMNVSIKSIQFSGGLHVTLSNGCTVVPTFHWENPPSPGLCPRYVGVDVHSVCAE